MASRLFKRGMTLTIAKPVEGTFTDEQPNAILIKDLRVSFSIEKALTEDPNDCKATIYNLSAATRAELQAKPLRVRLEAGYDGVLRQIFIGDLRRAFSKHEGTAWVTELELGDGERAIQNARVSRSFRAGVSAKTVLAEAARSMGLKVPTSGGDAKALAAQFAGGVSVSGRSADAMTKLLTPRGMSWSVQDGELQVLKKGEARTEDAIIVSQATGMIAVPEFGTPKKAGEPATLTVKMLLYPEIKPGQLLRVESASFAARGGAGLFRARRIVHTGDTEGADWYTEIEANEVSA